MTTIYAVSTLTQRERRVRRRTAAQLAMPELAERYPRLLTGGE